MSAIAIPTRSATRPEPLIDQGAAGPALLALFESTASAQAAILSIGARVMRDNTHGVVTLAADSGLRDKLYAAGALLVVS